MKYSFSLLLAVSTLFPSVFAAPLESGTAPAKAIYFITNEDDNSVVGLNVNPDGSITMGRKTPTGGKGLAGIDAKTNQSATTDTLFSQSAIKVEGRTLLAVNPGGNTLSMFAISPKNPTNLKMVGKPVDTMGDFPVSVAFSPKNKIACAANTGAKAGLACFKVERKGLVPISSQMSLTFPLGQSNPPRGPTNTVSHVLLNADESAFLTTVKGDPMANKTGFISVLPIDSAKQSMAAKDVRSSPNGTAVLFGSVAIPGTNNILATDAAFGATTLSIDPSSLKATSLNKANVTDQKATCWATFSKWTKTVFVTDVGVNHLVEVDPASGDLLQSTSIPNSNPGMIDLVSAGNMVYALAPGNGSTPASMAVMMSAKKGEAVKLVQNVDLTVAGAGARSQGMAIMM